jgi:hypothetical protein
VAAAKATGVVFAGVRIDTRLLRGFLQISGDAETFIGRMPPPAARSPLAPLGTGGSAPGTFDIILPVHIDYDTLRQSIMKVIDATPEGGTTIRDVQIYPSSGKIVSHCGLEKRLRAIQVLTNGPIFPLRRRSTRIVRPANFRISAQPLTIAVRCSATTSFLSDCDNRWTSAIKPLIKS